MRAAAIDIGSNSILLAVAEKSEGSFRVLCDEARVTGLSRKLSDRGEITEDAVDRAKQALSEYRKKMEELKPDFVKVVATEALRKAANNETVRPLLEKAVGHPIEIIDGEREASLSFWSVQNEWPEADKEKIVFDIGGASTELCFGNNTGIHKLISLKFGSVLLTEMFNMREACKIGHAKAYLLEHLKALDFPKAALGFGVAGTMTSLISVQKEISEFHRDKVHCKVITRDEVSAIVDKVAVLSTEDRKKIPGMPEKRADVSAAGFLVVLALMEHFDWNEVTCMDAGVRYGLLYEMFG